MMAFKVKQYPFQTPHSKQFQNKKFQNSKIHQNNTTLKYYFLQIKMIDFLKENAQKKYGKVKKKIPSQVLFFKI